VEGARGDEGRVDLGGREGGREGREGENEGLEEAS
jgi:hypothetical protein